MSRLKKRCFFLKNLNASIFCFSYFAVILLYLWKIPGKSHSFMKACLKTSVSSNFKAYLHVTLYIFFLCVILKQLHLMIILLFKNFGTRGGNKTNHRISLASFTKAVWQELIIEKNAEFYFVRKTDLRATGENRRGEDKRMPSICYKIIWQATIQWVCKQQQ